MFKSRKAAENWLRVEYTDSMACFISRKILNNKIEAIKIAGSNNVDQAELLASENEAFYQKFSDELYYK